MKNLLSMASVPMPYRPTPRKNGLKRALVSALVALGGTAAFAQTYTDIHDFGYKVNGPTGLPQQDGFLPNAGVVFDSSGNMYGTAQLGGVGPGSVLWEITASGVYMVLHDFGGKALNMNGKLVPDGYAVVSGVTIDQHGNLFGTAEAGGAYSKGMVWEFTNTAIYLDRHDFGGTVLNANGTFGPDGANPNAEVSFDGSGDMFGTAEGGGPALVGMVWEITDTGTYMDLHDFGGTTTSVSGVVGPDAGFPVCRVSIDAFNNLYGTASVGGPVSVNTATDGIVWEISGGVYKDIHDFGKTITTSNGQSGPDGQSPHSVTLDAAGNIYGTASMGGPSTYYGLVWKLTPNGQYTDLHDFGGTVTNANGTAGPDGGAPLAAITFDSAGNMYGTTLVRPDAGPTSFGNVWEITSGGTYLDLWDFGGSNVADIGGKNGLDGYLTYSDVSFDPFGNLYGTTVSGGQDQYVQGGGGKGGGIVWTLGTLQSVGLSVSTVAAGVKVTGTVTLGRPAPIGGTVVNLASSSPNAAPPATIKIPYGSTTGTFTIVTARTTSADNATITASQGLTSVTAPLAIQPVTLSGFSYFNGPTGGSVATIDVDLDGPAPAGGLTVGLTSNSLSAPVPATVFIQAGDTSTHFTIAYGSVVANTPVILTATLGAVTKFANITIKP